MRYKIDLKNQQDKINLIELILKEIFTHCYSNLGNINTDNCFYFLVTV